MVFFAPAFTLGLLVTFALAGLDPRYQKPQIVTAVSYAGIEPNSCDDSSFRVLTVQCDISAKDCVSITAGWVAEGDFVLLATNWVNSTGDVDHFYSQDTSANTKKILMTQLLMLHSL